MQNSGESVDHLKKLEDYIQNNISDSFAIDTIKDTVFSYFSNYSFDVENEVNRLLIKNLYIKLEDMKKEFNLKMNDQNLHKLKLENRFKTLEKKFPKMKVGKRLVFNKDAVVNYLNFKYGSV